MGNNGAVKAAGLLILSAIILAVGPLLTFISVSGQGVSDSGTGYEIEEGSPYVLAAVVIGLMGLLMFAVKSPSGRKVLGVIALLGALFAGFAAVVDLTGVSDLVADELGSGFEGSAGLGVWAVLLGALLGLIGSVMAIMAPGDPVRPGPGPGAPTTPTAPPPAGPPPA